MTIIKSFFQVFFIKYRKNLALLLSFLALPLIVFTIFATESEQTSFNVLLYFEQSDSLSKSIMTALEDKSGYNFVQANSVEQLTYDVTHAKAEVGYVFDKDFAQSLSSQQLSRSIQAITLENSPYLNFTNIMVFGAVFEQLVPYIAQNRLAGEGVKTQDIAQAVATNLADSTGIVELTHLSTATQAQSPIPLARAIVAMFVLIWSQVALVHSLDRSEDVLLVPILGNLKLQLLKTLPLYTLSTLSGIVTLALVATPALHLELLKLLYLQAMLFVLGYLLSNLLSPQILVLSMPIVTIFALLTHPILFDITLFAPSLRPVLTLLPTYQYLVL